MSSNIPMTFRIYKGDELVRTEQLTQEIIKVGVHPSSHLRIDDDTRIECNTTLGFHGPLCARCEPGYASLRGD